MKTFIASSTDANASPSIRLLRCPCCIPCSALPSRTARQRAAGRSQTASMTSPGRHGRGSLPIQRQAPMRNARSFDMRLRRKLKSAGERCGADFVVGGALALRGGCGFKGHSWAWVRVSWGGPSNPALRWVRGGREGSNGTEGARTRFLPRPPTPVLSPA